MDDAASPAAVLLRISDIASCVAFYWTVDAIIALAKTQLALAIVAGPRRRCLRRLAHGRNIYIFEGEIKRGYGSGHDARNITRKTNAAANSGRTSVQCHGVGITSLVRARQPSMYFG